MQSQPVLAQVVESQLRKYINLPTVYLGDIFDTCEKQSMTMS